jgi:hypothetical protein
LTTVSNNFLIAPGPAREAIPTSASRPAFALFLILNAIMFIRPAELLPQLAGLPFYEVIILVCLVMALPLILDKLRVDALARDPITLCVLAMLPAIVMSLLNQNDPEEAFHRGVEFLKVILYYLLMVSVVDSRKRLRAFLVALAIYTLVLTSSALLSYYDIVEVATVERYAERQVDDDGEVGEVVRLQGAGVYGNPNGLARIIAVGLTICVMELSGTGSKLRRALWLAPLVIFGHGLQQTFSRGGLLGFLAGIAILFHARYGTKKGAVAMVLLLPVLVFFSGRQTNIDPSSGTGQQRIRLWSWGLTELRSTPIFGIGAGRYFSRAGNDSHNSLVEAFVENGLIGGTIFTSAFFIAIYGLYRCKSGESASFDPELSRLRPYVLAIVVGTVVGQFSNSRVYFGPTYMILGLATIYLTLAGRYAPVKIMRVTPGLWVLLVVVSACTLVFLQLYTKYNAHF